MYNKKKKIQKKEILKIPHLTSKNKQTNKQKKNGPPTIYFLIFVCPKFEIIAWSAGEILPMSNNLFLSASLTPSWEMMKSINILNLSFMSFSVFFFKTSKTKRSTSVRPTNQIIYQKTHSFSKKTKQKQTLQTRPKINQSITQFNQLPLSNNHIIQLNNHKIHPTSTIKQSQNSINFHYQTIT